MAKTGVLYLSYDGLTDNLGLSQILPYLTQISDYNFKIHIVSCEKKHNYLDNKKNVVAAIAKKDIKWYHTTYTKAPPFLSTLWDLRRLKRLAKKVLDQYDIKIVHCRSYPAMYVAHQLKRKFNFKIIFDIRGFYLEERFDGNIWSRNNPFHVKIYSYLKKKEIEFYNESDAIVTLTESSLHVIKEKFKKNFDSIHVIPCCTDYELFHVIPKKSKGFNLLYLGSIGTWYLLDEMLDFFRLLLIKNPNATFTFATHDNSRLITERCEEKQIPIEKIRIQATNRSVLPELIAEADLSIFFIKAAYSKIASSPTKMGELLACGIPIVCNEGIGDMDKYQSVFPFMYTLDPSNITEEDIKAVIKGYTKLSREEIREQSRSFFSLEEGVHKYLTAYEQLL